MQFTMGALTVLLVLSSQAAGVSALCLKTGHLEQHHLPNHDGEVMIVNRANVTENVLATVAVQHALAAVHGVVPASSLLAKGNVWDTKLGKEQKAVLLIWATALLMGMALMLGLGAVALLLCCIYDVTANGLHWARFRQCQAKVQRANKAFASKSGDLTLCPYCVEHISANRGPNTVVFLCGHRFHVECSNKWFSEHPNQTAHCPICRDVEPELDLCKERCGHGCKSVTEPDCQGHTSNEETSVQKQSGEDSEGRDGALAFMLRSLHRCYPEIISEGCVERWMTCNTEIWLSELTYPRYNSILRKNNK